MNFSDVQIDDSIIHDFTVVPLIKFVLTLLQRVKGEDGKKVNQESTLQFNGVRHFKIEIEAQPWVQIVSHAISAQSDYLTDFRENSELPSDKTAELMHFHIGCSQGTINIIARSFTYSVTNEVPYVD